MLLCLILSFNVVPCMEFVYQQFLKKSFKLLSRKWRRCSIQFETQHDYVVHDGSLGVETEWD